MSRIESFSKNLLHFQFQLTMFWEKQGNPLLLFPYSLQRFCLARTFVIYDSYPLLYLLFLLYLLLLSTSFAGNVLN